MGFSKHLPTGLTRASAITPRHPSIRIVYGWIADKSGVKCISGEKLASLSLKSVASKSAGLRSPCRGRAHKSYPVLGALVT